MVVVARGDVEVEEGLNEGGGGRRKRSFSLNVFCDIVVIVVAFVVEVVVESQSLGVVVCVTLVGLATLDWTTIYPLSLSYPATI